MENKTWLNIMVIAFFIGLSCSIGVTIFTTVQEISRYEDDLNYEKEVYMTTFDILKELKEIHTENIEFEKEIKKR